VIVPGNNRLAVLARRGGETARDSVTFFADGETADLMVVLGWPSRGEIIDLWVREPSGATCKLDHRETPHGMLLDFSESAIGFGSQAYVARLVEPGRYRIKVHYWGAYDEGDGPPPRCHTCSPSTNPSVGASPIRRATDSDASWSGWTLAVMLPTPLVSSQATSAKRASRDMWPERNRRVVSGTP